MKEEKGKEIELKLRKAHDRNSYAFIYQKQVEKRLRWYDARALVSQVGVPRGFNSFIYQVSI